MDKYFEKLKKMEKRERIGVWSENPIVLSCLKQMINQDLSNIEVLNNLDNTSNYDKIYIFGDEKRKPKGENFYFLKNFEELIKNYKKDIEIFKSSFYLCLSLGNLLDLVQNFPLSKKISLLELCEKLAKGLNLKDEEIEFLRLSVSLKNVKDYLYEQYSKENPYSTKVKSPSTVQNLIFEFFKNSEKDFLEKIFQVEKEKSIITKIIEVCDFYLQTKDIEILRKESSLDPFIVEKLISILEAKKAKWGEKILLVDSDEDSSLIKLRLENQGFEVFWFEGAQEMDKIKEINPSIILSNILLPGIDGFNFLSKIRTEKDLQNIPFIFISKKSDSFNIKRALALGASDFLPKPLDMDILITKIHRYLNLKPYEISFAPSRDFKDIEAKGRYEDLKPNYIIFERFQIIKELGEGGIGKIYLSKDLKLKEEIVLKFLKASLLEDRSILEKFKEEVRIARKLIHPSIVRIYDFWEIGDLKFITQEYVEGRTLREILQANGPFPISIGLKISKKLCDVFSYAHSMGIIHRDIKPENIMVLEKEEVKILDFGIAKVFEDSSLRKVTSSSGETFGTPEYMSPEQLSSRTVDLRSDIYSLGIVFYEIFCGDIPFKGKSKISIALMQIQNKPKPPTNLNPKIPPELENIILKMLEKRKEDRFSSMKEVEIALKEVKV